MKSSRPFAKFEFLIAWRYLRARRSEGGISVMSAISLIGITLAVAALIIVLAVRSGFRNDLVDTILGSNGHVTVYFQDQRLDNGGLDRGIRDFDAVAQRVSAIPGITRAAPLIRGQLMANRRDFNAGVEVYGITGENLESIPRVGNAEVHFGNIDDFESGIAIGTGVARTLGVRVGDQIKLISPNGNRTAFGTSPRIKSYRVVYIFQAGRWDIDQTRVYMPFAEAQSFFNREGKADEIEVMVERPEDVALYIPAIFKDGNKRLLVFTWKDRAQGFLRALDVEDNAMFVIMTVLVLLSTMNIVSGLIMLVKNKGRDIGILRTLGMSEGTILRVFFICGAGIGTLGTALGVALGVLFVLNIDTIFSAVNYFSGGGVWDPSIRGIYELPAELNGSDVLKAVLLSLGLSYFITYFPARRAARLNPVEALRYE